MHIWLYEENNQLVEIAFKIQIEQIFLIFECLKIFVLQNGEVLPSLVYRLAHAVLQITGFFSEDARRQYGVAIVVQGASLGQGLTLSDLLRGLKAQRTREMLHISRRAKWKVVNRGVSIEMPIQLVCPVGRL